MKRQQKTHDTSVLVSNSPNEKSIVHNSNENEHHSDYKTYWSNEGPNLYSADSIRTKKDCILPTKSEFRSWSRPPLTNDKIKDYFEEKGNQKPTAIASKAGVDSNNNSNINSSHKMEDVNVEYDNPIKDNKLFVLTSSSTSYLHINEVKDRLLGPEDERTEYYDMNYFDMGKNGGGHGIFSSIENNLRPRLPSLYTTGNISDNTSPYQASISKKKAMFNTRRESEIPVINVFGLDEHGASICFNIHGYFPYLYVVVPDKMIEMYGNDIALWDSRIRDRVCESFAQDIEKWLFYRKKFIDNLAEEEAAKKEKEQEEQNDPFVDRYNSNEEDSDIEEGERISERDRDGYTSNKSEYQKQHRGSYDDEDDYNPFAYYQKQKNKYTKDQKETKKKDYFDKSTIPTHSKVVKIDITNRAAMDGAHCDNGLMFRIFFLVPSIIPAFRKRFYNKGFTVATHTEAFTMSGLTYDSSVIFENRFLVDSGLHGGAWFYIKNDAPKQIRFYEKQEEYQTQFPQHEHLHCLTRCQIEIDIHWSDIVALDQDDKKMEVIYSKPIENIRVMSFDIECIGLMAAFPKPTSDPIICINVYATKDSRFPKTFDFEKTGTHDPNLISICFSVGTSNFRKNDSKKKVLRGYGCETPYVYCFKDERELLDMFCQFVNYFDPDIITGYNTSGFDIPYIVNRCKALGVEEVLNCSRILSSSFVYKEITKKHKKNGSITFKVNECKGRLCWDVLPFVRDHPIIKYPSYSLNYVSQALFKEKKDDINHEQLPVYYRTNARYRDLVRIYCERDAFLAFRIFSVLQIWVSRLEDCRRKGIRLEQMEGDGTAAKAFPYITRLANREKFVIPYRFMDHEEGNGYVGATVQEPVKGFHDECLIGYFDYFSEYPCTIIANNICPTTFIPQDKLDEVIKKYGPDCYITIPYVNTHFLKKECREGILPKVEAFLLATRDKVKAMMVNVKKGTDEYTVLDCRQTQLKNSANGLYGLTGVKNNGTNWADSIAQSVTAYARFQIDQTVKIMKEERDDVEIIYGDTDSVLVTFGEYKVPRGISDEALKELKTKFHKEIWRIADICTAKAKPPNVLKAEYIGYPMLLIAKKKYSIMVIEKPHEKPKMLVKGLDSVRRSTCKYTSVTQEECMRILLQEIDKEKALNYVLERTKKLASMDIDYKDFIMSTRLNKIPTFDRDCGTVRAQEYLYQRMKEFDESNVPNLGDRIPYVIGEKNLKNQKTYSTVIHPTELVGKNAKGLDVMYYFEKQYLNPITTVLSVFVDDAEAVLRKCFNSHRKKKYRNDNYWLDGRYEISESVNNLVGEILSNSNKELNNTTSNTKNDNAMMDVVTEKLSLNAISEDKEVDIDERLGKELDEPMFNFPKIETNIAEAESTVMNTKDMRVFSNKLKQCIMCECTIQDKEMEGELMQKQSRYAYYGLCLTCMATIGKKEHINIEYENTIIKKGNVVVEEDEKMNEKTEDMTVNVASSLNEETKEKEISQKKVINPFLQMMKPQTEQQQVEDKNTKSKRKTPPKKEMVVAKTDTAQKKGTQKKGLKGKGSKSKKPIEKTNTLYVSKCNIELDDQVTILNFVKNELGKKYESEMEQFSKKWEICKKCVPENYESCANFECENWFSRYESKSNFITSIIKKKDFEF